MSFGILYCCCQLQRCLERRWNCLSSSCMWDCTSCSISLVWTSLLPVYLFYLSLVHREAMKCNGLCAQSIQSITSTAQTVTPGTWKRTTHHATHTDVMHCCQCRLHCCATSGVSIKWEAFILQEFDHALYYYIIDVLTIVVIFSPLLGY